MGALNFLLRPMTIFKFNWDFPEGPLVKNLPADAGNMGSVAGPGRSYVKRGN